MTSVDESVAGDWSNVSAQIDQLVREIAGLRDVELPAAGNALRGDDAAVSPRSLSQDVWRLIEMSASHLHACSELLTKGSPIEDGPGYALARASMEVAATAYWVIQPSRRTERIERYLTWAVENVRDECRAMSNLTGQALPEFDTRLEQLFEIARRRPDPQLNKVRKNRIKSSTVIKGVDKNLGESFSLLYMWQLASAHAHGRSWANRRLAAVPLDGSSLGEPGDLISIAARVHPPAVTAMVPVRACLALFVERVGLRKRPSEREEVFRRLFKHQGNRRTGLPFRRPATETAAEEPAALAIDHPNAAP